MLYIRENVQMVVGSLTYNQPSHRNRLEGIGMSTTIKHTKARIVNGRIEDEVPEVMSLSEAKNLATRLSTGNATMVDNEPGIITLDETETRGVPVGLDLGEGPGAVHLNMGEVRHRYVFTPMARSAKSDAAMRLLNKVVSSLFGTTP